MVSLPKVAEPLLGKFSIAFTKPTFQRAMLLFVGFVLTPGRHTVTRTLATVHCLSRGHFGNYHRFFSRARWSLWKLAKVNAAMVLELLDTDQPVVVLADDTPTQHRGKKVYGKARHRDPLRATRSHNVWLWGHLWVVLAIAVHLPFSSRPWALPVLCALYRSKDLNKKEGREHKTPILLARRLMATLMHGFPDRRFILVGDGHYASHELARFCHRHRRRLTLISLFHPKAHLCQAPPPRRPGQMGRRRIRGEKLPHPQEVVKTTAQRKRSTVRGYGGKKRRVEFVSGTGHWYKPADGLVAVRWVFVHDLDGTHEDRYFYSTDPKLSASAIIRLYTGRWSIEVTFQETKQQLGLASPRNRNEKGVLLPLVQQTRSDLQRRVEQRASAAVGTNRFFGGRSTRCPQKTPAPLTRNATGSAQTRGVSGQKMAKVELRYSEASGRIDPTARCFGIPQHDSFPR